MCFHIFMCTIRSYISTSSCESLPDTTIHGETTKFLHLSGSTNSLHTSYQQIVFITSLAIDTASTARYIHVHRNKKPILVAHGWLVSIHHCWDCYARCWVAQRVAQMSTGCHAIWALVVDMWPHVSAAYIQAQGTWSWMTVWRPMMLTMAQPPCTIMWWDVSVSPGTVAE